MNPHHQSRKIAICGPTGSGKTTLAGQIIRRWPGQLFIFDNQGSFERNLGLLRCSDAHELASAWQAGEPVCFNPSAAYPGRFTEAFAEFCQAVFNLAKATDGPKLLVCDEIQNAIGQGAAKIPWSFANIIDCGREQEIDLIVLSQAPNLIHPRLRFQLSEVIVFRFDEPLQLDFCKERGFDPEAVRSLPQFAYMIRRNGETKTILPCPQKPHSDSRRSKGK